MKQRRYLYFCNRLDIKGFKFCFRNCCLNLTNPMEMAQKSCLLGLRVKQKWDIRDTQNQEKKVCKCCNKRNMKSFDLQDTLYIYRIVLGVCYHCGWSDIVLKDRVTGGHLAHADKIKQLCEEENKMYIYNFWVSIKK